MSEPLRLVLCFHCHQPVGNFDEVFERATRLAYRPLLEGLAQHPGLAFVLHVSGPLTEWWQQHDPSLLELVGECVRRGQVELLASGLYEPILPVLPRRDRIDQVRLHRDHLRELWGVLPRGLWLTERVYEPSLAADLAAAGIQHVPLDDTHFLAAGVEADELDGAFLTEDEGRTLRVFPISARLRYLMPFEPVDVVMGYLRERHAAGQRLLVFGDDGEKFGLWPGTADWVHGGGWWRQLLTALDESRDWLRLCTFDDLAAERPRAKVYLPAASYFEMEEWALPVAAGQRLHQAKEQLQSLDPGGAAGSFLRGGVWRSFLARYPESNRIYQRMLRVSEATRAAGLRPAEGLRSSATLPPAVRALLRAQCNCAYWHGVFGGLHLPFLRDALIEQLLLATRLLQAEPGGDATGVSAVDLDADGETELWLRGREWQAWLSPARGGLLEVLDNLELGRDLCSVLGRREESYHAEVQAAEGPALPDASAAADGPDSIHHLRLKLNSGRTDLFDYDRDRRGCFALFLMGAGEDGMQRLAGDRAGVVSFETVPLRRTEGVFGPAEAEASVRLIGEVMAPGGAAPIEVEREYALAGPALSVGLTLRAREPRAVLLVQRFDLSLPSIGSDERCFETEDGRQIPIGEDADGEGRGLRLQMGSRALHLESSAPVRWSIRPLYTASRSESGVESCWQGNVVYLTLETVLREAVPFVWGLRLDRREEQGHG